MKKTTYGEKMAAWEHQQDEAKWRELILLTIEKKDYEYLTELICEGIEDGYIIPNTNDPIAIRIINNLESRK